MVLSLDSTVKLNSGTAMPLLGFGVWQLPPGAVTRKSVAEALRVGYRHIDTAKAYRNEESVGEGVKESGLHREDLFVTTKIISGDQGYAATLAACDESLRKLRLDYLDLYLIHSPVEGKGADTWRALEKLQAEGKCRAVGVSNFEVRHLEELARTSPNAPAVNQVEFHPMSHDRGLLEFCKAHGIVFEAYSSLGRGTLLQDPRVRTVAARVGRTPAQVLLRWGLQHGAVVIPRSSKPEHIRENMQLYDFELAGADMAALNALSS